MAHQIQLRNRTMPGRATVKLRRIAEWAEASVRDEIGPDAARVVGAMDAELILYGGMTVETRETFRDLSRDDQLKVIAFLQASLAEDHYTDQTRHESDPAKDR